MPGVAGWLVVAGCGFPTISTCRGTELLKTRKQWHGIMQEYKGQKKRQQKYYTCVAGVVGAVVMRAGCV